MHVTKPVVGFVALHHATHCAWWCERTTHGTLATLPEPPVSGNGHT